MLVLLLVAAIHSTLHYILKAILIVSSLLIVVLCYMTITNQLGWPVADHLPPQFRILSADIHEPSSKSNDQGAIYVWYTTDNNRVPRSIQLPYSKTMHKQMSQAMQMMAGGQQVYAKIGKGDPKVGKGLGKADASNPDKIDFIPPPDTTPIKAAN